VEFLLGVFLASVGLYILFLPIPSLGLNFTKEFIAKRRSIPIDTISLDKNRSAAEAAVFYLRKQSIASVRGLSREFSCSKSEIAQIIRRMEWLCKSDGDIQIEYEQFKQAFDGIIRVKGKKRKPNMPSKHN